MLLLVNDFIIDVDGLILRSPAAPSWMIGLRTGGGLAAPSLPPLPSSFASPPPCRWRAEPRHNEALLGYRGCHNGQCLPALRPSSVDLLPVLGHSHPPKTSRMMSTTCIGCGSEITDRFFMTVLDQAWHSHCVQCADCGEKLIDSCYTREKKLYCKSDFFK
jgi:hypothetical protein